MAYAEYKLEASGKCLGPILTKEREEGFIEYQEAFDKYGDTMGYVQWDNHESYLKDMSTRNPEDLFTLSVFGTDIDSISKKHFKNGKMFIAQAVVTYKSFNEDLLK